MNDEDGWYLPFLYLDGYIDIYGAHLIDLAIFEVTVLKWVDPILCERLSWLIANCNDLQGRNKCYDEFSGNYVQNSSNVYPDVENYLNYMFFGFSEKVAQIERDSPRKSLSALSGPLGSQNLLLQFTDALVINKARWNAASEDKKNAITQFVHYYMSDTLRTKIAMGEDLTPPRPRFLLQATETFYEGTDNVLYQDVFSLLKQAVAAPSLSTSQKSDMQKIITEFCVHIPNGKKKRSGKKKQEL